MLLPALLAGGRRVKRYSQLVVARILHCPCAVCCRWCLGYVHDAKTKLKKNVEKKYQVDMISVRIEVAPSSPISGIVTFWPYYVRKIHVFFVSGAPNTGRT